MEFWSIGVLRYVWIAPRDREVGVAEGAIESLPQVYRSRPKPTDDHKYLQPIQHPQPARGVQFQLGALLQHSNTPSPRWPGFEDDDENENEAPCEGRSLH